MLSASYTALKEIYPKKENLLLSYHKAIQDVLVTFFFSRTINRILAETALLGDSLNAIQWLPILDSKKGHI